MSMLLIKKWWGISSAWVRQHWRWFLFALAFLVVYIVGRRKSRVELLQAKLALRHYEDEKNAIIKAYETEKKLREQAKQKYDSAMSTVREKYKDDFNSVNMQKEAEIRRRLKEAKNNPAEIDRILEAYLGIKQE